MNFAVDKFTLQLPGPDVWRSPTFPMMFTPDNMTVTTPFRKLLAVIGVIRVSIAHQKQPWNRLFFLLDRIRRLIALVVSRAKNDALCKAVEFICGFDTDAKFDLPGSAGEQPAARWQILNPHEQPRFNSASHGG